MPRPLPSQARRTAGAVGTVLAAVAALVVGALLLGSCSGERADLGSLPPSLPPSTQPGVPTTDAPVPAPAVDDLTLGTDDLLGWIATPTGEPQVYAQPDATSKKIEVGTKTEAGAPTTFAIVGDAGPNATNATPGFYRVALRDRPNGSTGYVPTDSVTVTQTPFRIFVDLDARTLRVEKDGSGVFTAEVAIGTEENPTPQNGTYVTELIANNDPEGSYGPYAFGLAMHSDTLTEFAGGDGQVGIHGTNRPDLIGQRVSHGCVRLSNQDVQDLVDLQLPLGVPVFIRP